MIPVQMNNPRHNEEVSPPVHGDRKGKRATMSRRAWAVIALLAVFGMNAVVRMEFSLPDLGAYEIYPDRAVQTFAFLFATVAAGLLLWLGLRLHRRR